MTSEISTYLIREEEDTIKNIANVIEDAGGYLVYNPQPFDTLYSADDVDLEALASQINASFPEVQAKYSWNPNDEEELLEITKNSDTADQPL